MQNIAFPFAVNKNGEIETADLAESVRQSVKIILLTRKGERLMLPEFGTNLRRYLFEPLNQTIREIIRTEIINTLYEWENRIKDIDAEFANTEIDGNLCVTVSYTITGLNTRDNIEITL